MDKIIRIAPDLTKRERQGKAKLKDEERREGGRWIMKKERTVELEKKNRDSDMSNLKREEGRGEEKCFKLKVINIQELRKVKMMEVNGVLEDTIILCLTKTFKYKQNKSTEC